MTNVSERTAMSVEADPPSLPALISLTHHPNIPAITYINFEKFVLGRGYEAHVKILDKAISRKHCTLEKGSSNKWTITSHSRNAVAINYTPLYTDQSNSLKCGDKINLAGVYAFAFKCNPNRNKKCCCDEAQDDIVVVDLESEGSPDNRSIVSLNDSSSELSRDVGVIPIHDELSRDIAIIPINDVQLEERKSSPTTSMESSDSATLPNLNDVLEQMKKYSNEKDEFDESVRKSIDRLKEKTDFLKQLHELNDKLSKNVAGASKKDLSFFMNELIPFMKEEKWEGASNDLHESSLRLGRFSLKLNALLKTEKERSSLILVHLCQRLFLPATCDSRSGEEEKKPVDESISQTETTDKPAEDDDKLKDELKTYKQNSEWQEARIQYLEMMLKERDSLEKQLDSAKEESERLQTQMGDMRTKLSKVEVLELELSYLKERSKFQEDDKRDKDELEKQIHVLKHNLQVCKTEIESLTTSRSLLQNEMASLKEKCEEMEKKLNTKVGCSTNQATGEYCCDLFSSLKDNVLEALEKEFSCCICNEMFVQATVTNCNHVFCSYCLREWKKKKKQCPFCRAALTSEHRANVIDEFISNVVKCLSEKLYVERMQMIEDRKSVGAPPPAKRRRAVMRTAMNVHPPVMIPVAHRNIPYVQLGATPGSINLPYGHPNFVIDLINLG